MNPVATTQNSTTAERLVRLPALGFVIVYAALLLCIPSQLVVGAIGSAGTPANLWGLFALLWWVCATLGGCNPAKSFPARIVIGIVALSVLASYVAGTTRGWYAPSDIRQDTDELWTLLPVTVDDVTAKMISAADRGLLTFGGWAGIFLLATDGLRSWPDLERLSNWLSWLGTFVAALGILQFFTGIDIASLFKIPGLVANADFGTVSVRSVLRRVSSTAIHPIEFGVVMAGLFPIALHRTIHHVRSKVAWIPTIAIGLAIPMSVSRSAILAIGVSLVILLIGWPANWRRRTLVIAPLAAVAVRVMVPGLVGTIVSLFTNFFQDPSITGRTDDYSVALHVISENPWLGRGLFTFIPRYYRILDDQFLMILIELGIVGIIAVSTLFLFAFSSARGARRRTRYPQQKNLALSLSAAIGGVVLSYATFDSWGFPMAAGLGFLLMGMASAAWRVSMLEQMDGRVAKAQLESMEQIHAGLA